MSHGLEVVENLLDDDDDEEQSSVDESTPCQQTNNTEQMSDPELSPSERELSENPEDDCEDPDSEQRADSVTDFMKLLPYLLLVQRSLEASSNNTSITPEMPDEPVRFDASTNNTLYESQRRQSAFHLESLRNQLQTSSLRYLFSNFQQLVPPDISNGFHDSAENDFSNNTEHEMTVDTQNDEPLDLTQKNKNKVNRIEPKTCDDRILRQHTRTERGYTIQDLEAALSDIKSGKLGTRRAAVIYGIPRSTLRNKVYKMGKNQANKTLDFQVSGEMGQRQWNFHERNSGSSNSLLTTVPTLLPSHSEKRMKTDLISNDMEEDCEEDDATRESLAQNSYLGVSNLFSNSKESNVDVDEANGFVDTSYDSIFANRGKNFSQRGRHDSNSSMSQFNYPCVQGSMLNYDNMYSDSSLGKKSRPKRGKYRNYDRDALTKAVQAVQNGEMSVHRAGSYFGVPHSTLEYKVKERHLLRQAKNKGKHTTQNKSTSKPQSTAGCSSVTSLSPTTLADSNDSSSFQRSMPDLQRSLSNYLSSAEKTSIRNRWNSPLELLGLGLKDPSGNGNDTEQEKKNSFPDTQDSNSNEQLQPNNPIDLLDLTKKT